MSGLHSLLRLWLYILFTSKWKTYKSRYKVSIIVPAVKSKDINQR